MLAPASASCAPCDASTARVASVTAASAPSPSVVPGEVRQLVRVGAEAQARWRVRCTQTVRSVYTRRVEASPGRTPRGAPGRIGRAGAGHAPGELTRRGCAPSMLRG